MNERVGATEFFDQRFIAEMGKKPRLTFRKNYKIKRAIRNKRRRQEEGSESEHIEMNEDTLSRESSTAPTSVLSTSSEDDIPISQPSQVNLVEVPGRRAWVQQG